ncbi:MAG TPA: hypothetical protein VKI45_02610 [Allosphingosinicella sp.]|nr:hypothetical protein [Allosphingosinicella sp.]
MNVNQTETPATPESRENIRRAWTVPTVNRLSAGSAENVPGSAFADGPLETIGS